MVKLTGFYVSKVGVGAKYHVAPWSSREAFCGRELNVFCLHANIYQVQTLGGVCRICLDHVLDSPLIERGGK